jgi:putative ABC transport system permease protein/lipoprotein-releasing system permease protein
VLKPEIEDSYAIVPMKLVGTFEGPVWLALSSRAFIEANFPVSPRIRLVVADSISRQGELDHALERKIDKARARVWTYHGLVNETREALSSLYLIMNVVIGIIVFSIAFLVGMLSSIYFTQRLPEFATLSAIGYQRSGLLARVMGEISLLCTLGWFLGSALTFVILTVIKAWVMYPRGLLLNPLDWSAYQYTLPLPLAIIAFSVVAVWNRLRTLDPVSIIERRQ